MSTDLPLGNPWTLRLPALVMSHVVGTTNVVSVMAMAPVISADLGLSAAEFGAFISSYYAAQATGSLPAGAIADRFGVGRTLVVAHVLMVIAAITLSLVDGYVPCLAAMFLMGLSYSLTNPSTARGVLDWFPRERRGTAMGLKQVGVPIGGVIAAGSGALAAYVHWQSVMWGVALLIAANGIFCIGLIRYHVPATERSSIVKNIGKVLRDWNFNVYAIVNGLITSGQSSFFTYLTLFLTTVLRSSQEVASTAMGIGQVSSSFARIGWGMVADRYFGGRRAVLLAWLCAASAAFLVLMGFVGAWLGGSFGLIAALGLTVALGITVASFAPVAQAITVESVEPRLAGSAMGVNMVGVHLGNMAGPMVFGWCLDYFGNFGAAWWVIGAIVAAGTLMLIFMFKERGTE